MTVEEHCELFNLTEQEAENFVVVTQEDDSKAKVGALRRAWRAEIRERRRHR